MSLRIHRDNAKSLITIFTENQAKGKESDSVEANLLFAILEQLEHLNRFLRNSNEEPAEVLPFQPKGLSAADVPKDLDIWKRGD